jgi:hypothetical protein
VLSIAGCDMLKENGTSELPVVTFVAAALGRIREALSSRNLQCGMKTLRPSYSQRSILCWKFSHQHYIQPTLHPLNLLSAQMTEFGSLIGKDQTELVNIIGVRLLTEITVGRN